MNPVIKKSRRISPIWIIPITAAIICGTLFYNSYKNAGITIQLFLKSATGITAGKTRVMVHGIPVGTVDKISPDLQHDRITASITLDSQMEEVLVEDSIFWVVRPRFSASAISGLETILSGSYIEVQSGTSKVACREFVAAEQPPPPPENSPGLHLTLKATELGSLQTGSGIYYKNVQIGTVEQTRLLPDEDKVALQVLIKPDYMDLVREGSRFCNASGIQMSGNISSISLKIASFAALLRGGIELFTPKQLINTPLAKNHSTYTLYADFNAAEYGLPLTLHLRSSNGIVEGSTKIIYQGLVAGTVKKLDITPDKDDGVTAYIQLDPRAKDILKENTRFWMVKPELSPTGAQNLRLLITGSYITFEPGDGKFRNDFDILPSPPPQLPQRPGQFFHLRSRKKAPVENGSPVHFKGFQIGEVISVTIDKKDKNIDTKIFIYQDYLHLINSKSLFWLQSGIKARANIASGFSFETTPLASMLFGGIAVSSPVKAKAPAKDQTFPLYADYDAVNAKTMALYGDEKIITLIADNAGSLTVGSPILLKDIRIGEIKRLSIEKNGGVRIEAVIHEQYRRLISRRSRFYNHSGVKVRANLQGVDIQAASLQSVAAGGITCVNLPDMPPRAKKTPWKLYHNKKEIEESLRYFTITIKMADAAGIKKGADISYKGIVIGKIDRVRFAKNMQTVIAHAKIEKKARNLFREETMIWAQQPQLGLDGIKNAKALVFGENLAILPGGGNLHNNFALSAEPPYAEIADKDNGIGIVLETTHRGSISTGSPVYYRQVQVGKVTGYRLSPSLQKVYIFVSIKRRFRPLIRNNTHFWNVSGIEISGGLFSGVTLSAESLAAIASGGIALATPDIDKKKQISPPAKAGQHFPLHEKPDKSWLDWQPDIKIFEKEDAAAYLR